MPLHHTRRNILSLVAALTLLVGWNHLHAAALPSDGQTRTALGTVSIGGKFFNDIGPSDDQGRAVAIQADNKIVVAGSTDARNDSNFAVVRYTMLGALDTSFGDDGIVLTDFGGNDQVAAVVIQADGKIVVAGSSDTGGSTDVALARYLSNGTLDGSLSGDGRLTTDFSSGSEDQAQAMILQPDGKIVVAGATYTIDDFDFDVALARYTASGTLDPSFSGDGKVTTAFGDEGMSSAYGLALLPDGKLVAVGQVTDNGDMALARYTSSGQMDSSFSGDGRLTTDFGGNDRGMAVVIQADGKIVVAGSTDAGSSTDFALVRYTPSGSLDSTFGTGGTRITDFFGGDDQAFALARQGDSRLVVAGVAQRDTTTGFAGGRYQHGTLELSGAVYLPLIRPGS
jgi:uncharacterized delta-60 repeat protein